MFLRLFVLPIVALLSSGIPAAAEPGDFRPLVAEALKRGDEKIVIPPGTYRLAPVGGDKVVWTLRNVENVEIVADGVFLVSTKLTRALAIDTCSGLTLRGLTVDYDPLPFTQGMVTEVAEDKSWIDVKIHAGYPLQPYARIDVIDPATRYRKKGMPFLWGPKAELKGDVVRVSLPNIGAAAQAGDLASLNTGPAADGVPHAISIEHCNEVTFDKITVHSAPGMGILEADGEGHSRYQSCKVVPGPRPAGASENRLLSTSWDAMQTKTVRFGPKVEDCEIREAGDDSWSVQSSDYLVLKNEGKKLILASRDEFTDGVQIGDRLRLSLAAKAEAKVAARRGLSREEAGLAPETMEKLKAAEQWSEWKVSPRCIEVDLDTPLPAAVGDSLFSPDRMCNGFSFRGNRIHSPGRVLIKASGMMQGNVLDTPHSIVVCPELPEKAAAGIHTLVFRRNHIRRAGWFCPAPWSSQAGALSITAAGKPPGLRPAGVFSSVFIENNTFEECEGPNLVMSSTADAKVVGNRFIRPMGSKSPETGASYGIPSDTVMWFAESHGLDIGTNLVTERGSFAKEDRRMGPNATLAGPRTTPNRRPQPHAHPDDRMKK